MLGVAYFMAVLSGIAMLAFSIFSWRLQFGEMDGSQPIEELVILIFASWFGLIAFFTIFFHAFTPVVLLSLICEAFSIRSLLAYILFGGLTGLFLYFSSFELIEEGALQRDGLLVLAAGFVSGFFFWLIAGRKAGSWRGSSIKRQIDES